MAKNKKTDIKKGKVKKPDPDSQPTPKKKGRKKTVKSPKEPRITNSGYHQYIHELSLYYKKQGIKTPGRGNFLKNASKTWVDLKGKPNVIENLDVIIPQYFERPLSDREKIISDEFSVQQYTWWEVKILYNYWATHKDINITTDRLIVLDTDGLQMDISDQMDAWSLYKTFDKQVGDNTLHQYSYLSFVKVEKSQEGVTLYYQLHEDDVYFMRMHDQVPHATWSKDVTDKWAKKRIKQETRDRKAARESQPPIPEPTSQPPISTTPSITEKISEPSGKSSRLDELIKYKQSLMEDIRFSKEIGDDYSDDMAKLKTVKASIDKLMS